MPKYIMSPHQRSDKNLKITDQSKNDIYFDIDDCGCLPDQLMTVAIVLNLESIINSLKDSPIRDQIIQTYIRLRDSIVPADQQDVFDDIPI